MAAGFTWFESMKQELTQLYPPQVSHAPALVKYKFRDCVGTHLENSRIG